MTEDQTPATRASLILRLRNAGDLRAWQEFVEIYQPVIFAMARKRQLQESDADDVTQEVLTRIARSIAQWDPDPNKGSFRAWLATITRNLVIQFFRDQNRRPTTGLDSHIEALARPNGWHGGDEEFDRERERQIFLWAAHKIRPRFETSTWQAFWLTAVECEAVKAVADRLQTTKAQVYVARSRVMRRLRDTIQQTQFDTISDREGQ